MIVAGGDGTVHEAVDGAVGMGGVLGVLPVGTGNDYALALGMSQDLGQAARQIATTAPSPVDVGRVRWTDDGGEHEGHFANGLGAGFDAHAAALAAETKWVGGRQAYLAAVLRTLWQWRRPTVSVRLGGLGEGAELPEGLRHDGPLFLCSVGNGHSVGGGFLLTPDARLDDGLLDVCVVRHLPTHRALRLLPRTFSGGHTEAAEVGMGRVPAFQIEATAGRFAVHADGEVLTTSAVSLQTQLRSGALRVIAPRLAGSPPGGPVGSHQRSVGG